MSSRVIFLCIGKIKSLKVFLFKAEILRYLKSYAKIVIDKFIYVQSLCAILKITNPTFHLRYDIIIELSFLSLPSDKKRKKKEKVQKVIFV